VLQHKIDDRMNGYFFRATRRSRSRPCTPASPSAPAIPGTPSTEILEAFSRLGGRPSGRPTRKWRWRWAGRGVRECPDPRHDETRRPERRCRPALHRRVHRRERRADRGHRRRPRHGLLAERAGQPPLWRSRPACQRSNRRTRRRPTTSSSPRSRSLGALAHPGPLRMTTRVCHSKSVVVARAADELVPAPAPHFERDIKGRVMIPAHCPSGPPAPPGEAGRDRGLG